METFLANMAVAGVLTLSLWAAFLIGMKQVLGLLATGELKRRS